MFARLGSFAVRFRWYIIAAWVVAAVVLTLVAPNINDVSVSDQRAFLSPDVPSLQANELMKKYFPDQVALSSAVLVIDAGTDGDATTGEAAHFVAGLTSWLTAPGAPEAISLVWSPTRGDEMTKAGMISQDKQLALILVRFNAIATEPATKEALAAIRAQLAAPPSGVQAYMTGDGPILDAYSTASMKSMDSVTIITIILVLVILLLIYRSPVSPFIPLATIGFSYLISRAVIAYLGSGLMTISMYTNVFLIVVLFGAGTDYCLFLISRFREEMTDTGLAAPAVKTTVRAVGETIASSAGTVIVGLAMMVFAELGLYNTTGPAIAIGVAITLVAGLTLIPALLSVLGHRAFWPRKARHMKDQGLWPSWAAKVVKRPLVALLVPIIVLVPLAWYGNGMTRDFDMLADLPKEDEARVGFDVLAEHMGAGSMRPLNVLVMDQAGLDTTVGLARIGELQARLEALDHVAQVNSFTASLAALQASFAARPGATLPPQLSLQNSEALKSLRAAYFSPDGTAARLQVVLDVGPYSDEALATVGAITQTLSDYGFNGAVEGNSAVLRDLRDVSDRDMTKTMIFVLGGILVVLILLLRALVAPIYLILTILLSYTATLGVVRLLFVDILGASGITWWVPMFMFVMLVALGMDYNIFLIGRVKEEVATYGTREGTRLALARTGGIITSAGIIMAGTFASMMAGRLLGLLQIGFAVAFGVLLDTFVVRTTLVPAITVLLGRWSWWPRRGPGKRVRGKDAGPPAGA